jgi:threonine synthase
MLLWARLADAQGMSLEARDALVLDLDERVAAVDGHGFVETPMRRSSGLSLALGFSEPGGIWLKDETLDVAGSAKARHLLSIALHLLTAEQLGVLSGRPQLAIASCGNAAIAAATLAKALGWPIEVFVPTDANPAVVERLRELTATLVVCERRANDPPGDPCIHRFHEAVEAGAVPFSVQGPENALCLDGGRTIGWEITESLGARIDRIYAQVGGGALATSLAMACVDAGTHPWFGMVQTQGCAPLDRAWRRWQSGRRSWDECMWPWSPTPTSHATGILDDETYDWLGIVKALSTGRGDTIVVTEAQIQTANELVANYSEIFADHTGTAALAGLLATRSQVADDEVVVIPITGVRRWWPEEALSVD